MNIFLYIHKNISREIHRKLKLWYLGMGEIVKRKMVGRRIHFIIYKLLNFWPIEIHYLLKKKLKETNEFQKSSSFYPCNDHDKSSCVEVTEEVNSSQGIVSTWTKVIYLAFFTGISQQFPNLFSWLKSSTFQTILHVVIGMTFLKWSSNHV